MNREQAINYLFSSGFTNEQVGDVVRALTYEPTTKKDCNTCTHSNETDGSNCYECVKDMRNNYEPTTKNDLGVDCISRAEAIKCLECDFDITGKENMKTVVNYINSAHDKIMNLPSVKQEPKTGHWINIAVYFAGVHRDIDYVECSCCHYESLEEGNYCPNCGAKMEGDRQWE